MLISINQVKIISKLFQFHFSLFKNYGYVEKIKIWIKLNIIHLHLDSFWAITCMCTQIKLPKFEFHQIKYKAMFFLI